MIKLKLLGWIGVLLLLSAPVYAGRYALVIGNGAYPEGGAFGRLVNTACGCARHGEAIANLRVYLGR